MPRKTELISDLLKAARKAAGDPELSRLLLVVSGLAVLVGFGLICLGVTAPDRFQPIAGIAGIVALGVSFGVAIHFFFKAIGITFSDFLKMRRQKLVESAQKAAAAQVSDTSAAADNIENL